MFNKANEIFENDSIQCRWLNDTIFFSCVSAVPFQRLRPNGKNRLIFIFLRSLANEPIETDKRVRNMFGNWKYAENGSLLMMIPLRLLVLPLTLTLTLTLSYVLLCGEFCVCALHIDCLFKTIRGEFIVGCAQRSIK